eukprot:scaffold20767_cov56-Phaeocystis_antarctica.AAC.6
MRRGWGFCYYECGAAVWDSHLRVMVARSARFQPTQLLFQTRGRRLPQCVSGRNSDHNWGQIRGHNVDRLAQTAPHDRRDRKANRERGEQAPIRAAHH